MVIMVVVQSAIFMREAFRAADQMGISRKTCFTGMRAAAITSIGPAMGPVVILISLISILGAPTTWMRLNDIGAARTELLSATIGAQVIGVDIQSAAYNLKAFSYSLWSMALTDMGWIIVALILTPRMKQALDSLTKKTDKQWVTLVSAGAAMGLFSFLTGNQVVGVGKSGNILAAVAAAVTMLLIGLISDKYPRLQEISLGAAMVIGMFTAATFF
ncbi:hypothetical protein SRRS_34290 [Sporomusa rhizae]